MWRQSNCFLGIGARDGKSFFKIYNPYGKTQIAKTPTGRDMQSRPLGLGFLIH